MRKRVPALLIFVGVFLGTVLLKDHLVKAVVVYSLSRTFGADASVEGFSFGVLRPVIRIRRLLLFNPRGFPADVLLDVAGAEIFYDRTALLKGKLVFDQVRLQLREVVIAKAGHSNTNIEALSIFKGEKSLQKIRLPLSIRYLSLDVDRIVYKDFTSRPAAGVQEYELGIRDSVFQNVSSPRQLMGLVLAESLGTAAARNSGVTRVAALFGVSARPSRVPVLYTGRDSAFAVLDQEPGQAYDAACAVLRQTGRIDSEDRQAGVVKATVRGRTAVLTVQARGETRARITVSARLLFFPQPALAGRLLSDITAHSALQ